MAQRFYDDVTVGDEITLVKDPVSKLQLLKYAAGSGDFNLIHIDAETARAVGLGDVIAHGMLSMGCLGQLVSSFAGQAGFAQKVAVRFQAMVRLGDVLTCTGVVRDKRVVDGRHQAYLEIKATNQKGEVVTSGEGVAVLPSRG